MCLDSRNPFPSSCGGMGLSDTCETEPYCKSFSWEKEDEYHEFFLRWGFVVVDNIIPLENCDATVDAIWSRISEMRGGGVKKSDPTTWDDMWPAARTGIFGSTIARDRSAWRNRQNERLYGVFKRLYGEEDLLVSADRYNIMRPTVGVPNKEGQLVDRPEWLGPESWFHWDLNPWHWLQLVPTKVVKQPFEDHGLLFSRNLVRLITEGNDSPRRHSGSQKLQGLVALGDTPVETGGFQCIPGFVGERLKQWAEENIAKAEAFQDRHFVTVPQNEAFLAERQVIGIRKGSLLVWSSELPHCNRGNHSSQFRYCQYIKMIPEQDQDDLPGRAKCIYGITWMDTKRAASQNPKAISSRVLGLRYLKKDPPKLPFKLLWIIMALFVVLASVAYALWTSLPINP